MAKELTHFKVGVSMVPAPMENSPNAMPVLPKHERLKLTEPIPLYPLSISIKENRVFPNMKRNIRRMEVRMT